MNVLTKAVLALALSSSLFGGQGSVAQAADAKAVTQLKAAGASFVPMSRVPKGVKSLAAGGDGTAEAEWCVGAAACLDLIESNACKSMRCGNDHGTPVCWCD